MRETTALAVVGRRGFVKALASLGIGMGLGPWTVARAEVLAYGPLGEPDANGIRLPDGFRSRLLATTGQPVLPTPYVWHLAPDGGATFADGNGWVYVSNSEANGNTGGVSAVAFDGSGAVVDAYRILADTKWNCAGGATPWGTWLSCEEYRGGLVWECDPRKPGQGIARPGLGKFIHEAAVVDPVTGFVYLTEDEGDGRFYRFRPAAFGDLSSGVLEAAAVSTAGAVTWFPVTKDRPYRGRETTAFDRGEGAIFDTGRRAVFFTTTSNDRVWAFRPETSRMELVYDAAAAGPGAPLHEPDNVTVHARTGHLYVAEDADDLQLVLLVEGVTGWQAAPFLQLVGHDSSEITGPAFNPAGDRLYFSSQRGTDGKTGLTYEITGPFLGE